MTERSVALLRGVNVGGKNRLAMKDLALVCGEVGCENVVTYIQSGNVVFTASRDVCPHLPELIANLIGERHGIRTTVVRRSTQEIADLLANNPFRAAGVSEETLHVLFLADEPASDRVVALNPDRSPPDQFVVRGREVYLHCPGGVANTKLTVDYFGSALRTTGTARNWRTVTRLYELMTGGCIGNSSVSNP